MTLRISASAIAPDLRFVVTAALANPGHIVPIGDVAVLAESTLPQSSAIPLYLRYADRDAAIATDGLDSLGELEVRLAEHLQVIAKTGPLTDLSLAALALDAVDRCFRQSGLWSGNIYLAGAGTIAAVLHLARSLQLVRPEPETVLRELAALELAYLFPVAGKFRASEYDGQIQYRLNGWGRSLAARLTAGHAGAAQANALQLKISQHLASENQRYASLLNDLDVARQHYRGNLLGAAQALPIPVLV